MNINNLREVVISLTNRCNLRCRMCDVPAVKAPELATADWERVIRDAAFAGARTIVFSGGEPLLRDDIFDLVSSVKKHKMSACLTSNGYLLNDAVAFDLKGSGVDVVNISIEGPQEIHDQLRGEGVFEKALEALQNLKKHKIESTVAATVSQYNYRYLSVVVDLANRYSATTVKFQPFSHIFVENEKKGDEFFIPEKEIEDCKGVLSDVVRQCAMLGIATNPKAYLERIPAYLASGRCERRKECLALHVSCPINSQGDVFPCWVLTDIKLGNVREENLFFIWNSGRRQALIDQVRRTGCKGCIMSCYDENFGRASLEERAVVNMQQLKHKGLSCYLRDKTRQLYKRMRFYGSYRGSLSAILRKIKGILRRKQNPAIGENKVDNNGLAREIEAAKKTIMDQMRHWR